MSIILLKNAKKKKDQEENKEDGAMLTAAIENMQGEKMEEVMFVATDLDKMSLWMKNSLYGIQFRIQLRIG